MEHYNLNADETVLFKCEADNGIDVILTNTNLVLIKKIKKLFSKAQITVDVYPIESIKIYNDIPQVKQSGYDVEIFLTSTERIVTFCSKNDARKFVSTAFELLTGKTAGVRGAEKVKSAIGVVDDTLGIDTVGTVKTVLETGVTRSVLGVFGKKSKSTQIAQEISSNTVKVVNTNIPDSAVEKLKKLKELLDAGIITQEEFEEQKVKILRQM